MRKIKVFQRTMSTLLLLALIFSAFPQAAFAAVDSDSYYTTFDNLDHAWQNSTDMVDVSFQDWEKEWVEWLCDTGKRNPSFSEIVAATYDATIAYAKFNYDAYREKVTYNGRSTRVENLPKDKILSHLPQYTFSECLNQVDDYADDNYRSRSQPEWTESDYTRFMVGLLRVQNIPAYIVVGTQDTLGRFAYRVAIVDSANKRVYYSDPARGVMTGNTSKWRWLTQSEYDSDFRRPHIYNENIAAGETLPEDRQYTSTAVSIPAADRYEGIQVPVRKNGHTSYIYMRAVVYDGGTYLWIRDVAKILEGTSSEIWIDYDGTLLFGKGDYQANGVEVNWTDGRSIPIDTLSQAYLLSHAYFGAERIKMNVLHIGSDLYVRPGDIASALGARLNINISF